MNKSIKHLSAQERHDIQEGLSHGKSYTQIAKELGKHRTTISKEVIRYSISQPSNRPITNIDGSPLICPRLIHELDVCNSCKRLRLECGYSKTIYKAVLAQRQYDDIKHLSRAGINIEPDELKLIDDIITDGISKGQHLYHIIKTNNLSVAVSTVYKYIQTGVLSVDPTQLPRKVKFKARKRRKQQVLPKGVLLGRTYDDFQAFITANPNIPAIEMDTVIGRIGGKVIMTFIFPNSNFMFARLLENKSSETAANSIRSLKEELLDEGLDFSTLFPVLLTDRGGEFFNAEAFEDNGLYKPRTRLFYCDPYTSSQKPHVENNHTLFRCIAPSGTSFDNFSQGALNEIFSHVNSVIRKDLNDKTSYDMFTFMYGDDVAAALGIRKVPPKDVIQSPRLLRILGLK